MKNEKVIFELKKIAKSNGGLLMPEQVVKYAEDEESPLHSCFEWSDDKAAHSYRLWQARQLISVSVEYIKDIKDPVRVFVSLSTDRRDGGYRMTNVVMSAEEMRTQLLDDAKEEMVLFEKKYKHLKELSVVFSAMHKVKKKLVNKSA